MDEIITEKDYPIRITWIFSKILVILVILLVLIFFILTYGDKAALSSMGPIYLIPILAPVLLMGIPMILRRSNFHYSLDHHFMVLHQGVISKQNRNVPYGRIQGVFVNQDLLDRFFGLASLTIEDFSDGGTSMMDASGYVGSGKSRYEVIGFVGNKIHIPGLKKGDAEALKEMILQKVKESPIEDSQSGL